MTDAHAERGTAPLTGAPETVVPGVVEAEAPAELDSIYQAGLQIEARSVWRLALKRFVRHKLAMGSLILLIIILGSGLFADTVAPYSYDEIDLANTAAAPTFQDNHFFGTDLLGRDYFSRVVYGIRTSAQVALIVAAISTLMGTAIGATAGYFGGWVDNLLMRFTDLILTLPILAVLLIASALIGEGSPTRVAIILGLFFWTTLARLVRGTFLSLREKEFVEAAKALGASDPRIIIRHMIPNSLGPIIVNATLVVALAILVESALSFLGFGIKPPTPSLGNLIEEGRGTMLTNWWLVFMPGITIVLVSMCINFVGDGMRDALDPTQRKV